jgi:hypothetical protein
VLLWKSAKRWRKKKEALPKQMERHVLTLVEKRALIPVGKGL